jgi:hypothetical protein
VARGSTPHFAWLTTTAHAVVLAGAAWALMGVAVSDGSLIKGLLPWSWWVVPIVIGSAVLARQGFWIAPALVVVISWSGALVTVPAVAGWLGKPAIALVALTAALASRWRLPQRCFDGPAAMGCAAALSAVWVGALAVACSRLPPTGDEPHYLMIAISILKDGDLSPINNYLDRQYLAFYPGLLGEYGNLNAWHLMQMPTGQVISIHSPGLAALVLPGFAVAAGAWIAWATLVLSEPFAVFGSRLYPDGPAAAAVIPGLWLLVALRSPRLPGPVAVAAVGAALGCLPWLHIRLSLIAAVIGLAVVDGLGRRLRRLDLVLVFMTVPICSALTLFAWTWLATGSLNPLFVYRGALPLDWLAGVFGLVADQEVGWFIYAPVYMGAVLTLPRLWRTAPDVAGVATSILLGIVALSATYLWWGGASPPARFISPVLPGVALGMCLWWPAATALGRQLVQLAIAFGVLITVALASVGRGSLLFNQTDRSADLFLWLSSSSNLSLALPSFLPAGPLRSVEVAVTATWGLLGLAAILTLRWIHRWRRTNGHHPSIGWAIAMIVWWVSTSSTVAWALRDVSGWRRPPDAQEPISVPRLPHTIIYTAPPPSFSAKIE